MSNELDTDRTRGWLANTAVLVTGAAGHLGRAIVLGLASDGALPVLNGRNEESLIALSDDLAAQGYKSLVRAGNVSDEAFIAGMIPEVANTVGADGYKLLGLINNAYAGSPETASKDVQSLYTEAARINLGAIAHLTEVFAGVPTDATKSIVNVASMYGIVSPDPELYPAGVPVNPPHYGATKAGLLQLTRYFAVSLAQKGVRVNSVTPGAFPNPGVQEAAPEFIARLSTRTPMKRIGQPEELYPAIRFLISSDASFVTGSNVTVDGGWTAI